MCYGHIAQKHSEIAYAPWVARDMISQQHVYKLCVRIDSTNDNQYWTSSINSAIEKCFHRPNSQGAPNMVKQKHNSSYGITKLHAGNVLYLEGASMMV
jgi:hypothetical protein